MAKSRRTQRLKAFQFLYSQEFQSCVSEDDLRQAFLSLPVQNGARNDGAESAEGFAWDLVLGVWQEREDLDAVIARFSRNWRIERVGRVELTILRLGAYEILRMKDVPPLVAINEALELERQFGDPRSFSFVNGILDSVYRDAEKSGNGTVLQ